MLSHTSASLRYSQKRKVMSTIRGDFLGQRKLAVTYPARIQTVISAISGAYADLLIDIWRRIHAGVKLTGTPQNEAEATYSLWRVGADSCASRTYGMTPRSGPCCR